MPDRDPVVLVVMVDSSKLAWFAAFLELDGTVSPLVRSEEGNLEPYLGKPIDEQISFLRHRLCGVLQRGCDRLWGLSKKAVQFAFVFDGDLESAEGDDDSLATRAGQHFSEWLNNPPTAAFLVGASVEPESVQPVAGSVEAEHLALLQSHLSTLLASRADEDKWEIYVKQPS